MKRVYFLRRASGEGPIKIGCSVCPEERRRQIGSSLKEEMTLLADVPGDFRVEGRLHRQFADLRVEGEWFEAAPSLLAAVEQAARTGRAPPAPEDDRDITFARRYLAGETLEQIAAGSGITRERVRQLLRKCGIPSLGYRDCHKRHSLAEQRAETIIAMTKAGHSVPDIARAVGDTGLNVSNCLRRHGVTPVKGKRRVDEKTLRQADEVARRYLAGEPGPAIARAVGIQQPHIYRLLRIKGIAPTRGGPVPVNLDPRAVLSAYRSGVAMHKIADAHGCSPNAVRRVLKIHDALLAPEEVERRRREAVSRANARRAGERRLAA